MGRDSLRIGQGGAKPLCGSGFCNGGGLPRGLLALAPSSQRIECWPSKRSQAPAGQRLICALRACCAGKRLVASRHMRNVTYFSVLLLALAAVLSPLWATPDSKSNGRDIETSQPQWAPVHSARVPLVASVDSRAVVVMSGQIHLVGPVEGDLPIMPHPQVCAHASGPLPLLNYQPQVVRTANATHLSALLLHAEPTGNRQQDQDKAPMPSLNELVDPRGLISDLDTSGTRPH